MGVVYVTWEEIKQVLPDVKETQQAILLAFAERACRRFDRKVGVPEGFFGVAAGEPTTRIVYGGDAYDHVLLPPFVAGSVESVSRGTMVLSTQAYQVIDRAIYFPNIYAANRNVVYPAVPYSVTARFGFAAVPDDVKEAVIQLIVWMWESRAKPYKGLVNGRFNPDSQYDAGMPRELRDSITDIHKWCIRQGWILP